MALMAYVIFISSYMLCQSSVFCSTNIWRNESRWQLSDAMSWLQWLWRQRRRKSKPLSARRWNVAVGFHPRQALCNRGPTRLCLHLLRWPAAWITRQTPASYTAFLTSSGHIKAKKPPVLQLSCLIYWSALSTLSEQWMQGPRSRPSPSDFEWKSSIFSDHTDPIVRSKLMESSLNTGFPLQQQSVFVLGGYK